MIAIGYESNVDELNRRKYLTDKKRIQRANDLAEKYSYIRYQSNYAMKKENGKWKINGICTGDRFVNHKYCLDRHENCDYRCKFPNN